MTTRKMDCAHCKNDKNCWRKVDGKDVGDKTTREPCLDSTSPYSGMRPKYDYK